MSDIGAMVETLVAAGANPAVAASIVAQAFAAGVAAAPTRGDEPAERRRAKDRERKANVRRNPQTSADSADAPISLSSSSPIKDSIGKEEKKERAKSHGLRMSADWAPNAEHYALGAELGLLPEAVDRIGREMRDWADSNAHRAVARKSNWNAAFSNWLRKNGRTGPPATAPRPRTVYEQKQQEMQDVRRELQASIARTSHDPGGSADGLLPGYPSERSASVFDGHDRVVEFIPPIGSRARG